MEKYSSLTSNNQENRRKKIPSYFASLFQGAWKASFPKHKNHYALNTFEISNDIIKGTSLFYYIEENIPKTIRFNLIGHFHDPNLLIFQYESEDKIYRGKQTLNIHPKDLYMVGIFTTKNSKNNHKIQGEIILIKM